MYRHLPGLISQLLSDNQSICIALLIEIPSALLYAYNIAPEGYTSSAHVRRGVEARRGVRVPVYVSDFRQAVPHVGFVMTDQP